MNLSEFSLKRPVTTLMLTICALVVGVVALDRLPIEQLPSISSSGITARVQYNNSSPEEIERLVVLPLEQTLGTLNNIDRISSSSGRNQGEVRVDFKAGTDMDLANMEMREKLDQARALLPSDVDRVSLRRWQSDQRAIIDANLAWRGDGDRLLDLIQKVIEPRLLRINGVVNVVIDDFEEKQLIVELDQERLQTHNISLGSLGWQLNENNTNISLGRVMDGDQRYMARAIGEFTRAEDIASMPLMGGQFRLSDIGEINYGYPEKRRYERLNGTDALELEIFKASTANVIDVGEAVVAELQEIEDEYKGELGVFIDRNRAESVLKEAGTLLNSALLGAFLAMIIIFVFLRNIRSTIVIALAIPTSALCVFIGMYVAREVFESTITLNMVSMMGLMLAVGMLVDPAVVVLESIFRRRQEDGLDADEAAHVGSREVGMAVLASALTTICVFVPFFFLSDGRSAMWMKDAGIAICLAVMVSMIVSLSLIPLVSSRLLRAGVERFDRWLKLLVVAIVVGIAYWQISDLGWSGLQAWWGRWSGLIATSIGGMQWQTILGCALMALAGAALGWYCSRHGLRSSYGRLLNWTLDHRWVALLATVMLTGTGYYLYNQIEQRGTPWTPERRVDMSVVIDRSYSLDEIRAHFEQIEDIILAKKDSLDLQSLMTRFGQRRGSIRAYLIDADEGRLSTMEAGNAIKELLPEKVGYTYKMGRSRSWTGNQLGRRSPASRPRPRSPSCADGRRQSRPRTVARGPRRRQQPRRRRRRSPRRNQPRSGARLWAVAARGRPRHFLGLGHPPHQRLQKRRPRNRHRHAAQRGRPRHPRPAQKQPLRNPRRQLGPTRVIGRLPAWPRPPRSQARESDAQRHRFCQHRRPQRRSRTDGTDHPDDGRNAATRWLHLGFRPSSALGAAGESRQQLRRDFCRVADLPNHGLAVRVPDPSLHHHLRYSLLPDRRGLGAVRPRRAL